MEGQENQPRFQVFEGLLAKKISPDYCTCVAKIQPQKEINFETASQERNILSEIPNLCDAFSDFEISRIFGWVFERAKHGAVYAQVYGDNLWLGSEKISRVSYTRRRDRGKCKKKC